ncbi:MAG: hypothetical protein JNK85_09940, partial [Verrucomicrobiales bacterium]|nr:hypothetical protein [Verrucomicrobiales bacterium]
RFIASPAPKTDSTIAAIDRLYAPFLTESCTDRTLATALKGQIARRTAASTRATLAWMHGQADPAPWLEQVRQCDERIRELLGQDLHLAFRRFEQTLPDRERIERFRQQASNAAAEFSLDKEQRLVAALAETRSRTTWSQPLSRRESITTDLSSLFHPATLDLYEREETALIESFRPRLESLLGIELATQLHQFSVNDLRSRVAELRRLTASPRVEG